MTILRRLLSASLLVVWLGMVLACGGGGKKPDALKPDEKEPTDTVFNWKEKDLKGEIVAPGTITRIDATNRWVTIKTDGIGKEFTFEVRKEADFTLDTKSAAFESLKTGQQACVCLVGETGEAMVVDAYNTMYMTASTLRLLGRPEGIFSPERRDKGGLVVVTNYTPQTAKLAARLRQENEDRIVSTRKAEEDRRLATVEAEREREAVVAAKAKAKELIPYKILKQRRFNGKLEEYRDRLRL